MIAPPKRVVSKKLGELLLERKIIDQHQLEKALQVQKEIAAPIGSIIVLLGYATEEKIAQALTTQFGFPYLPLANYEIDKNIVKLIPESVAKQHNLIAVDKVDNSLSIAVSNPLDINAIKEDVEPATRCKVRTFISTSTDIEECIKKHYG